MSVLWKYDITKCKEYIRGECFISCLFEDQSSGGKWVFIDIYNKDEW